MKDNIYDEVLARTLQRVDKAATKVAEQFKNVKPFDKEQIPKRELVGAYRGLSVPEMHQLIEKYGADVVDEFIYEMETESQKQEQRNARRLE